jgi:hypothetical protein
MARRSVGMWASRSMSLVGAMLATTMLMGSNARAQDLFELEVFEYESAPPGTYEVDFHTNGMTPGSLSAISPASNHRPLHLSVEVTRGWTERFETAVFIQTAPFGSTGSARFAGGHLRSKYRLGITPVVPIRIGVSAEYTFNRLAFDQELQTLEIRPIIDYRQGRLWMVVNPSIEMVTRGPVDGVEPTFDLSAGARWQLMPPVAVTADYFSRSATTRHLAPEVDAHHLFFAGLKLDLGSKWDLSLGLGHCVTANEPWLIKSVFGFRF